MSNLHSIDESNGEQGRSSVHHEVVYIYRGQPTEEIPKNVTHLLVHPSIRRIEDNAFENCQQLRSITIPPTVEVIGDRAFMRCISLVDVQLHEGLKSIGIAAFQNCTSLMEINLPKGLIEIAKFTFGLCRSLRTISVPITVERIGSRSFADCKSLVDVFLPNGLKRIDSQAFVRCNSLSSVAFPPSLEFVGHQAFLLCKCLQSVEIAPRSKVHLSSFCFDGRQSLVNLSIPKSRPELILFQCELPSDKRDCLIDRFSDHPVHSLCYNSSLVTRDQITRVLDDSSDDILVESSLKDDFDMTPFHVVACSASLNPEILERLLERYPIEILHYKDYYGNTMMDYLLKHTSHRAVPLLQMVLRHAVICTVSTWYPQGKWSSDLSMLIKRIPVSSDLDTRRQFVKAFFVHAGCVGQIEITSLMEQAVWKTKMSHLWNNHVDDMDRDSYRYQSDGVGIVIENVVGYLWEATSDITGLSLFPLCSSTSF